MFTHKHYVPILKAKTGERWALGNLRAQVRAGLTPLLELVPHNTKSEDDHLEGILGGIASVWGTSQKFFLDTAWMHGEGGNAATLATAFELARELGLQAIPVVRPTYDDLVLEELANIVATDGRGYLMRLRRNHLSDPEMVEMIENVVETVDLPRQEIDLLLDYRNAPMQLTQDVPNIPDISDWRTFIAAAGVFPRSLSNHSLHQWHQVAREDYTSWELAVVDGGLARRPAFGDYAMRDPGAPAGGGQPSANLRYARENCWWVRIGQKLASGGSADMYDICASLVQHPAYCGQQYSIGDAEIWTTAQEQVGGPVGPGGPTQWLQWCVNHHMTQTVNQIRDNDAL